MLLPKSSDGRSCKMIGVTQEHCHRPGQMGRNKLLRAGKLVNVGQKRYHEFLHREKVFQKKERGAGVNAIDVGMLALVT